MNIDNLYQTLTAMRNERVPATPETSLSFWVRDRLTTYLASKRHRKIVIAMILLWAGLFVMPKLAKPPQSSKGGLPVLAASQSIRPGSDEMANLSACSVIHGDSTDMETAELAQLAKATHRIDVAVRSFTDLRIASQLATLATKSGVQIRVYRDAEQVAQEKAHATAAGEQSTNAILRRAGIPVTVKRLGERMNLTGYVVDDKIVRTGSASWTPSELGFQDADAIYIECPTAVTDFDKRFGSMWTRPDNSLVP